MKVIECRTYTSFMGLSQVDRIGICVNSLWSRMKRYVVYVVVYNGVQK